MKRPVPAKSYLDVLVYVTWEDAQFEAPGWEEGTALKDEPPVCHSVGWLVSDTERSIKIAGHRFADGHCGGVLTIPKSTILEGPLPVKLPGKKRA